MRSLFTQVSWPRGRRPKRADVLQRIESIMPWERLKELIEPHYPKPKTGRPPYPIQTMIRVYVLQWLFQLSDEAAEDLILDSHSAATFAGLDPWSPRPPGATAIRNFRTLVAAVPADEVRLELQLARIRAKAEIRPGRITEPVVRMKPKGQP